LIKPGTGEVPWLPAPLKSHGFTIQSVGELTYIVLDEMVGDDVGLALWPWPVADQQGRLRFRRMDERCEVGTTRKILERELYAGWRSRHPRVGDVFAARVDGDALEEVRSGVEIWERPLGELFPGPVYDMTVEARHIAKLAYYASIAPVMRTGEPGRWDLPRAERNTKSAPVKEGLA
jgi:hypothetical protein